MVWFWTGPDAIKDAATLATENGESWLHFQMGALDFAGGTVVHINAAVGRLGWRFHDWQSVLVMVAKRWRLIFDHDDDWCVRCCGWVGSVSMLVLHYEANDTAALAFINTLLATAAATVSWVFGEWITKGKPSMLGGASGAVAGLVAITPACGLRWTIWCIGNRFVGRRGVLVGCQWSETLAWR